MIIYQLSEQLSNFITYLRREEFAENSVLAYGKDINALLTFLSRYSGEICKEHLIAYKAELAAKFRPSSANRHIAAVNKFMSFLELNTMSLKTFKVQEQTITDHELTEREVQTLLYAAMKRKAKIALIMLVLAYTGIRIGELRYITVKAVKSGHAVICNKGKYRTVVLTKELQGYLLPYMKEKEVQSGPIFIGKGGAPISRSYVAREMKAIAQQCGLNPDKVYPHNFRHYFARRFLDCGNPLTDLADILGHKSVDTTRRYLRTSIETKIKQLSLLKIPIELSSLYRATAFPPPPCMTG